MTPNSITLTGSESVEVMRLTRDGIWVNPDVAIDDTAKAVLAAIDVQLKLLVQKAVEAEREECAKVVDRYSENSGWEISDDELLSEVAGSIRARG